MNNSNDDVKETLKPFLKDYVESITEADRRAGHNMYKCPLCGSGTRGGRDSNGAFSITPDGLAWKCFACDEGGDIFTLIGLHEHLPEFKDQIEKAKNIFNITEFTKKAEFTQKTRITRTRREARGEAVKKADFTNYIEACKKNVSLTNYWSSRGFNAETVEHFNLGYDQAQNAVIIPYNKQNSYYITRKTTEHEFRKPSADIAGDEPIFNLDDLYNAENKPVFICEGPIDAMSIKQAGGFAIALGGTGYKKLLTAIENKKTKASLIISLDNDEKGEAAAVKLAEDLKNIGVDFSKAKYTLDNYPENKRKDANDFLITNFEQLRKDIALNTDPKAVLLLNSGAERLGGLIKEINDSTKNNAISTGFKDLDRELDGGLYSGLYIIGAISSLGKTTLILNIADNIAATGQDVLYFSLEMGANELMARSISKLTYTISNKDDVTAKTSRGITAGKRYAHYSNTEKTLINEAFKKYSSYSKNIYFYEGIGNIGVEEIKETVKKHIKHLKQKPIVFIDYLQILAPYEMRATDKQNTDKAVLELKRLSRDFEIPIVAISSFNRDNYTTAVGMTAFKESGAIDYGSDVLIGLQPQGMTTGKGSEEKNKATLESCKTNKIRDLEAVILKNRNGKTNGKINFSYYPMFNYFEETSQAIEKIQTSADRLKEDWEKHKDNIIQR